MKVIADQMITDVSATSESTSRPASFLLDDHPKRVWRAAGDSQAKLTFTMSAGATGIAIFNTNATRTVCNLGDPCEYNLVDITPIDIEIVRAVIATTTYVVEGNGSKIVWVEFGEAIPSGVVADATLTNDEGETIEAGVAIGGVIQHFRDPAYGMAEAEVDYSTELEMSNGSFFTNDRDVVRTFSGTVMMERSDFWDFTAISKSKKKNPFAWKVTDLSGDEWTVYARFSSKPIGRHIQPGWVQVEVNIIEVI